MLIEESLLTKEAQTLLIPYKLIVALGMGYLHSTIQAIKTHQNTFIKQRTKS